MKTKKLILGALLVVLGTSSQAQIVSSQSNRVIVTEQGKPVEPIKPRDSQWYVKAGLSMDKLAGAEKFSATSVGYDVSFGFIRPTTTNNLFWGAEFGVMSIGGKTETGYFKMKNQHAITISPFIGYDIASIESVRISPYIGPYLSYALNKCEEETGGSYNKWISNKDSKLSGGVNVGVGFWIFDKYCVDVHFKRALLKNMEGYYYGGDFDAFSQKVVFGLGMAF